MSALDWYFVGMFALPGVWAVYVGFRKYMELRDRHDRFVPDSEANAHRVTVDIRGIGK